MGSKDVLKQDVLIQIEDWARSNKVVRAAILTSSRAKPDTIIDEFSDYDIELYVTDLQPFRQNDDWLAVFGPIMVRWPHTPRSTFDERWITRLILFKDYIRIDFQITNNTDIEPGHYDDGYQVLVDKDELTGCLDAPTFQKHLIKRPGKEEFESLVNEFWWDATYVPKYLWRDELPFAKYMLDNVMRYEYLHRLVEWYIGSQSNWLVNAGLQGRWFKKYLDGETWTELEATYTGAKMEENWHAFFRFIALFRRLGREVAERLDYGYPVVLDKEVTAYCEYVMGKR